ncbi:MAG: amidohydrolase [Oscillospiraceae bacterium]|nr:amidohydrolase [Oscillospiraceae bacterium]
MEVKIMIIDAHAHIFPDKIAARAADGISSFYNMRVRFDGTVGSLLEINRKAGINMALVQSVATVPEQVHNINSFVSEQVKFHPQELIGFGALHPDFIGIEQETERIISLGLKGIKLHPDFQQFNLDDERAFPIYEAAEGRLPILFHVGDSRYDFSSPRRLYNVMKRFPKLTIIGAHLAGWTKWDEAEGLFSGSGIYADCSSSLYAMSPERAAELIRKIGTNRVMFGTDYPMWSAVEELERFNKLPLTDEERQDILCRNAMRLLGIQE